MPAPVTGPPAAPSDNMVAPVKPSTAVRRVAGHLRQVGEIQEGAAGERRVEKFSPVPPRLPSRSPHQETDAQRHLPERGVGRQVSANSTEVTRSPR